MGKTLEEMMSQLPKERQEKIEAMAAELIAEEMSLRELRQEISQNIPKLVHPPHPV